VRVLSDAADYLDRNYYGLAYRETTDEVVVARARPILEHVEAVRGHVQAQREPFPDGLSGGLQGRR